MKASEKILNPNQLMFKELFVGTLIYAVVLGFFNDYTDIVYAKSFSTIFLAAILLEVLTYLVFQLKSEIINWLKNRKGIIYRFLMFFSVWFIMFISKFIFIWAVDIIFGSSITIFGFFGILWIVLCVTILHRLADRVFIKLGNN